MPRLTTEPYASRRQRRGCKHSLVQYRLAVAAVFSTIFVLVFSADVLLHTQASRGPGPAEPGSPIATSGSEAGLAKPITLPAAGSVESATDPPALSAGAEAQPLSSDVPDPAAENEPAPEAAEGFIGSVVPDYIDEVAVPEGRLILPLLAILAMLTACGTTAERALYQAADAKALVDAGAFSGVMTEVNNEVVPLLFAIGDAAFSECSCYAASNTSVSADEVAVFVMEDTEGASAAINACKQRVEAQIDVCRDYCPDQVPRLEDAVILQRGSTVLFAVGDPEKLPQALKDLGLGG